MAELTLAGVGINEMDSAGDPEDHTHLAQVAQALSQLGSQTHNVVLADGNDLRGVGHLVVVGVVVDVVGDQLFSCAASDRATRNIT